MKKIIVSISVLLMLVGCETGKDNMKTTNKPVLSGIVDKSTIARNNPFNSEKMIVEHKATKGSNKIFSKSGQPGYYLQMAVFAKYKPSKAFLKPLKDSSFKYTVLNHYNRDYVLIGPYKSYNAAKSKVSAVKKSLKKQTFVVQVLRP